MSLFNEILEQLYSLFLEHPHISTDSRHIAPKSIFFALRGESFDGNNYAISALEQGAVACVIDDANLAQQVGEFSDRLILVDDVLETLQQLSRLHREALGIDVLAITGSNGKTTTKELIAAVLSTQKHIYATRGNFNNHIGVPLTLLSMDRTTEFGVVEMGASSCGEIELLCSIAKPNYGIVTNVGRAHLEGFGGASGVRRGKGELMDWLEATGGTLFVAQQNDTIIEMAEERNGLQRVEYSYSLADDLPHHLEGEYNRYNVAAAVKIGEYFGVERANILSAIANYQPTNNRSQRNETGRNTLIIDCYNANPSSMEVAIDNFSQEVFSDSEAKVLILGDMRELGEWSKDEHQRVIRQALTLSAERIILVGKEFQHAYTELPDSDSRVELYATCEELLAAHAAESITSRAILIKGSRGIQLERIIATL